MSSWAWGAFLSVRRQGETPLPGTYLLRPRILQTQEVEPLQGGSKRANPTSLTLKGPWTVDCVGSKSKIAKAKES